MDVPELEVFQALAEELHFRRTAERLYLSQPSVSRLVASLEREVGGTLFERTSRRVRLTSIGERLRADLRPAYAAMRLAIQAARHDAMGAAGVLRAGLTATTEGPALILSLAAQGRAVHPTVASILWADRSDIMVVPIAGLPPAKLGLVWHSVRENARIRALAQAGRRIASGARDVVPGRRTRTALPEARSPAGSL